MKLHWFHLAPWQNLPDDFTDRYRGVWVDVPNEVWGPVGGHRMYNELLDEQMGFDGICVNEHHHLVLSLQNPRVSRPAL